MSLQIGSGITIESGISVVPQPTVYVSQGLQLYLDAGLTSSYPGAGPTWFDLSGNGNNLTFASPGPFAPIYYTANGGYFDMTNSGGWGWQNYATTNMPNSAGSPFCLSAWVRPNIYWSNTSSAGDENRIFSIGGSGFGSAPGSNTGINRLSTYYSPSRPQPFLAINWDNVSTFYGYPTQPAAGWSSWVHLASNYDGTTRSLWVNGVMVKSDLPASSVYPATKRSITLCNSNSTFRDYISVAMVYNRGLTSTEILQNFTAFRSRYGV